MPAGKEAFLILPDVDGLSMVKGHEKQWVVAAFGLSVVGGPGAAAWSLGVTIDAGGAPGLPQIYSDAASGAVLSNVTLQFVDDSTPQAPTFLTIALTNARITGTTTTVGSSLAVALNFAFTRIDFSFAELDARGQPVASLDSSFDLSTNAGTPAAATTVAYSVGGAPQGTEGASAFVPPSQQTALDPTGAGAGQVAFSPGSITMSFVDASVLDTISRVAMGTALSDLSVQLVQQQGTGAVAPYMTYDFANASEVAFGMSGLTSTFSFVYRKIEWTTQSSGKTGGGTTSSSGWDLGQNTKI
jgi:type VI protein secretion system component Hcp